MALHPDRKKKRDNKLRSRFNKLDAKKTPKGKPLLTFEAIVEKLSEEFDLSEFRVIQILKGKK